MQNEKISGGITEQHVTQLNITSSYRYYYNPETNRTYYREDPIILEVVEKNSQFSNFIDNFEIEIFEIDENNTTISQPKYFIEDDYSPKTPQEFIEQQKKIDKLEKEYQNLVKESLEILLDEQAESLFPKELLTKKDKKPKIICDD